MQSGRSSGLENKSSILRYATALPKMPRPSIGSGPPSAGPGPLRLPALPCRQFSPGAAGSRPALPALALPHTAKKHKRHHNAQRIHRVLQPPRPLLGQKQRPLCRYHSIRGAIFCADAGAADIFWVGPARQAQNRKRDPVTLLAPPRRRPGRFCARSRCRSGSWPWPYSPPRWQ